MTFKKFIIIFLLILSIFSFSSVHAENINVTSSSSQRMETDIDYLKQLLKKHNINNMNDLKTFLGASSLSNIQYFYIEDAGHMSISYQHAFFYYSINNITNGVDNYNYYGIQQNSFTLPYNHVLVWNLKGDDYLSTSSNIGTNFFVAPICWFCVKTVDLFTKDSSEIVANAVKNLNNSVNNLNDKITEDNSSQNEINLGTHNDEMNNASDSIKNSNLYSKFDNITNEMVDAFTYDDDTVTTLLIPYGNKNYVLYSNDLRLFFENNHLHGVVLLWQSILWFSLFYTMFIFIRKLYKAFSGGNPVDDVASTLSNEDNKIVGGF